MSRQRLQSFELDEVPYLHIDVGVSTRPPRVVDGVEPPAPEALILQRWQRLGSRRGDGYAYRSCRLPASLWRRVDAALRRSPELLSRSADEVGALLPRVRAKAWGVAAARTTTAAARPVEVISPRTLLALLRFLARRDRLRPVLEAYRDLWQVAVPLLLLYRVRRERPSGFHFVMVKGPVEMVSANQESALRLLRSLGLPAGIVVLQAPPVIFTAEERAMLERSVDAEMERWARSLLLVVGGEVRRLNEEEVQTIAHPSAPTSRRRR